jgi:hypothetical protein
MEKKRACYNAKHRLQPGEISGYRGILICVPAGVLGRFGSAWDEGVQMTGEQGEQEVCPVRGTVFDYCTVRRTGTALYRMPAELRLKYILLWHKQEI